MFINAKEGKVIRLALQEMGHPQPPTPIHCDDKKAVGIANDTIKKQRSWSMEMLYFWIPDKVKRKKFDVKWYPGQENLADYLMKHFEVWNQIAVRHGISILKTHPIILHGKPLQVTREGALEPQKMDT